MSKDFYEILWLSKNVTQDEIKKAYRKLAMQYHPDRWWDENKFKEINEAYSILSDENKKNQYDTYWTVNPNQFSWFWNVDIDLWDIFESFFSWGRSYNKRPKNTNFKWEDLEYLLNIDLKTSIFWWKKELKYSKMTLCVDCNWIWWKWKKECWNCKWTWYVKYRQQTLFWTIEHRWTCENCNWTGEIFEELCKKCNWNKRIKQTVSFNLDIPPWIDDKMIIKIAWEWNHWINWENGSLYVKFNVDLEEKWLKRKWKDLYYDLDIDVIEAILGTEKEINIPILWKRIIYIESWTQIDTTIKINWDGVKIIDKDKKWDLYIFLKILIPKKINVLERELYEKIAKEKKINVKNKKWIFEKLFG